MNSRRSRRQPHQSPSDKPLKHRQRFALVDLEAVDRSLLYKDSGGKLRGGLILEIERRADGHFDVRQAAPSKLTRRGIRGKIIGSWKFLNRAWENGKAAGKKAAQPSI
jgi:hypothetical protein